MRPLPQYEPAATSTATTAIRIRTVPNSIGEVCRTALPAVSWGVTALTDESIGWSQRAPGLLRSSVPNGRLQPDRRAEGHPRARPRLRREGDPAEGLGVRP